jgi:hypothetical protein
VPRRQPRAPRKLLEVSSSESYRLRAEVTSQLSNANAGTVVAFAAITAERLMRLDPQRRPFTQSLRPLLDLIWRAAAGDSTAFKPIAVALGHYYFSDYCHNDGPNGPDDADDDPAAAILYAALYYLHMRPTFAASVATRAIDAADHRAQLTNDSSSDFANSEEAMVAEASQQLATLAALAPLAQQLGQARMALPDPERERLLAQLQALVVSPRAGLDATVDVDRGQTPLW